MQHRHALELEELSRPHEYLCGLALRAQFLRVPGLPLLSEMGLRLDKHLSVRQIRQ